MDTNESTKFRSDVKEVFGDRGQAALARLIIATGDGRSFETILRTINNWAAGRHRVPPEAKTLMHILRNMESVPELLREARRDPPPPAFALLPKPKRSAAPNPRKPKR